MMAKENVDLMEALIGSLQKHRAERVTPVHEGRTIEGEDVPKRITLVHDGRSIEDGELTEGLRLAHDGRILDI